MKPTTGSYFATTGLGTGGIPLASRRLVVKLGVVLLISALLLTGLSIPLGPLPPLGGLLEPAGGFWTIAEDAGPVYQRTLSFPGLMNPVEIYRDEYYVPHIFAQNDTDLFMAVGYIQASDRLFEMDLTRRLALGSLSEALGASFVETDVFMRSMGLRYASELGEQALLESNEEGLVAMRAFAEGVNVYIQEVSPGRLPLEFKLLNYRPSPWKPLDSIALGKYQAWSLSASFMDLELKLFRDEFGAQATEELFPVNMPFPVPIIPPGQAPPSPVHASPASVDLSRDTVMDVLERYSSVRPLLRMFQPMASNNWVVGPEKSATGAPILANDLHLLLTLPSVWYAVRLSSPSYNVYGVTFPGVPVVVIGFNEHIAWGMTNVGADVTDFFVERVNPEDEDQYLYKGQWRDFDVREEVIQVRGGSPVTLRLKISVHGPVITSHNQTVAMQWTGHMVTSESQALASLNTASNWAEFRAALENFQVPAQNFVYADADGNIGIVVNGLYPIRAKGLGRFPVNGSTGEYDWVGNMSYDEVPSSFNPSQGFLVSANQIPTADNVPYLDWSWADRYRAARINERLRGLESVTVEDMKALQQDHFSIDAREFVPILVQAFQSLPGGGASLHSKAVSAIQRLQNWDFIMDANKVEPALYLVWLHNYREATFRDEWDARGLEQVGLPSTSVLENLTKFQPDSIWFDDVATQDESENRDAIIRRAFVETLDGLEEHMGSSMEQWSWGEMHRLQVRHLTDLEALSSDVVPRDGGPFTVDVAGGAYSDGEILATHGPSWRMVVDFSPTLTDGLPIGYGSYPGGQSGHPMSPHYQDLFALWRNRQYHELQLTEEEDLAMAAVSRR